MYEHKNLYRVIILALFCALITGCGDDSYNSQEHALVEHLERNKIGSGSDYWIVKTGSFLGPSKIGLIFGYPDDASACREAVALMNEQYGQGSFSCEAAN